MSSGSAEKISENGDDQVGHGKSATEDNDFFVPAHKRTKRLPPWLDHFNSRDLKLVVKCSIAAWVMTLLIFINPALKVIGQATFFGILVIIVAPPSGVVFTSLLAGMTLLIGMGLGWTWGVITMKAALSARPAADLQRQYQALQEAATRNTTNTLQASGQATYQQVAIFEGALLDTRVTAVYFCMLGLFIYLVARIRVVAPKLALLQMFAIIVSDIFLTIGPLIPTFNGTIPRVLILPATIGLAISLACNVLIFPKSTSHIVLNNVEEILAPTDNFLDACSKHFASPSMDMDLGRLKQTKGGALKKYGELEQNLKFMALDVSVCRWSAGDIKSIQAPLREFLVTFNALLQTQIGVLEYQLKDEELTKMAEQSRSGSDKHDHAGGHQLAKAFDLRTRFRGAGGKELQQAALKDFATASHDLIHSCRQALSSCTEAVRTCNHGRWFGRLSREQCETLAKSHADVLQDLQRHQDQFPAKVASSLWSRYGFGSADADGDGPKRRKLRSMNGFVQILVLEEKFMVFADALRLLLDHIVFLERARLKTQFWLPGSMKNVATSAGRPQLAKPTPKDKKGDAPKTSIEQAHSKIINRQGGRQRSRASKLVIATARWFSNAEGLYALRVLIVSICLGILAVNKNTAGFFYREKGLWGLIMAQTALMPYTADFVYGLGLRLGGTVLGAIIGLAAWYIGAGNGPGNPYGMAAIMVPVIVVAMWLRLFTDPALLQAVIITTVTVYLVVAYSWVDTHIPSYGNPGVGYAVFWRRLLLVIIGFAVAAFVTLFPRPPSASRHYRELLFGALGTVKDQYALFVSCKSLRHQPSDVRAVVEKIAIQQGELLVPAEQQVKLTKLELSSSNLDSETLSLVCHLCMNLNQHVTQLTIYTASLPQDIKHRFFYGTAAADEQTIANIMAVLTLAQHALKHGDALPAVLPVPLMERTLTSMKSRLEELQLDPEGVTQGVLEKQQTRGYFAAISAFAQFLGSLDELLLVLKRAVGETSHVDLDV